MLALAAVQPPQLRLDGDVVDSEALVQHIAQLRQHLVGVALAGQLAVAAQRHQAGSHRPDVQVVQAGDAAGRRERRLHLLRVDVCGRRLQQHRQRLAQQPDGPDDNEQADNHPCQRVGQKPARGEHDDARRDDAHGAQQIAQHVVEGAADVQAAPLLRIKDEGARDVRQQADHADRQHGSAANLRRVGEALSRLPEDEGRHQQQDDAVRGRRQHLRALIAEGALGAGRTARHPDGEERHRHREHVRYHVPRIGQQCQAVSEDAPHQLHNEDARR